MYYPNIFYCQYVQKGFHADVVHYLSSFSNMAKLLWLTEKYYDCKLFLVMCNLLSAAGSDGVSDNYVSERFLIIYLVCVCAHKAF